MSEEIEEKVTEIEESKNIKFYLVIYLTDGTIHLYPADSKMLCKEKEAQLKKTKWQSRVVLTRIIKRNLDNYKNNGGYIL